MKSSITIWVITISVALLTFFLSACGQKKSEQAFEVFNEGVSLNLAAIEEQNKGNIEQAAALNRQSVEKFRRTLALDSAHPVGRSALAHSLYVDKQFKQAIHWFEQSNKINGPAAVNYREMGLCKISIGQIPEGKADIDQAFSIDTSKQIRDITLQDLVDVGQLAFEYGQGYIGQGELDKGKTYQGFAINVLMLAFEYDKSRKDIASTIAELSNKLGDPETASKYKALAGQ